MKVMEVSVEEKDCTNEIVTPPRKKMKQAQLPFQMVSSLGSPNTIGNKKRKLESPSPVESKSPRTGKIVKKQNASKRAKSSEVEIIEVDVSDVENVCDQDNVKALVEFREEGAAKHAEKNPIDSESDVKKRKDYGSLNRFLKKAQSKESKDDLQLLAMSDYESGSSKDSDASLKVKLDLQTSKEVLEQSSKKIVEQSSEETAEQSSESKNSTTQIKENSAVSTNITESQYNIESLQNTEQNTSTEEKKLLPEETKNSDTDSTCHRKDSIHSDSINAKNDESDSDTGGSSSDEDVDDDPDKSSNENTEKDKTLEENDGSKTPRSEKSGVFKNRKLTPKQIERRLQSAKKREEKQQLKMEKKKKREEQRENRRKQKEEKEKLEKEQKRKEKEMKELKKQIENEQKQKEKEAKEEERRKKEEEAERKKQKAASNFANFFVPKKQETKALEEDGVVKDQNFMPFEVKVDMKVAPITRRNLNNETKLTFDGLFNKGVLKNELYLNQLKRNRNDVGRSGRTWPCETKDDVVIIDEEDSSSDAVDQGDAAVVEKHHPKFFMFAENRRPPFWGTWRKKSTHIKPRKPFAKDPKWFDYDVDSDDEWEEEEPGESLRGSDDEREEEGPEENEYDVDNEFMVPHGYLSDEEAKADEEDGEDMSPETQKLKLKLLGEQFEAERKTKTSKIKPKVIGCVWQGSINAFPENTTPHVIEALMSRQAWVREIPVTLSVLHASENLAPSMADRQSPTPQSTGPKKKKVPEEAIPNLIRLVHGNTNGRIFLMKEFMAFWEKNKTGDRQISKLSFSQKLREIASWIACPEEGPMHTRSCWYVREDIRKKYDCLDVTLPNRWKYTLRSARRSELPDIEKTEKVDKEKEKKRIPLITQFTKKITQEEMQKQLGSKSTPSQSKPPKRAALISLPRGEQFQKLSRNNLFSKFATCGDSSKSVECQEDKADGDREVLIIESTREIQNLDRNETKCQEANVQVSDVVRQAVSETEQTSADSKIAENSEADRLKMNTSEALNLENKDTEVIEAKNKSPVPESMDIAEDNVVVLD
ncbi:chromatin assembly factor 1 subunit A [Neodiprion lecontei]|uniref:Chromatin assembly factor 1 subunit A n=1 Tax=Neodiprion lecontei TaxID=441921 RepID=A0A6J0BNL1_NEOLC|nr:chromatin assembly factor 1 subunit A [Neodiprion lecontei]XP_046593963.1 chromatin assembly factor 1 subunit A [Neodiprion lecontei]